MSCPRALSPRERAFLDRVRAEIDARLAEATFGAEALADALGLSRRQLDRRLGELSGETAAGALRRRRLERAAALLAESRGVAETVHAVGFASGSGFRAAFGAVYGAPPAAYRRSLRGPS